MNGLITPANFDFFARYLLAGFILLSVRSRFVSTRRPLATEVLFEAVILSLLNQLAFLVIASVVDIGFIHLPQGMQTVISSAIGERAIFFSEVLVLPVLLGITFGFNLQRGWNDALLRRLSLPVIHPVERAYDFAFIKDRSPGFVILTFKDGSQIYGFFGTQSLASTDRNRSDIYLERLYNAQDDGQWLEATPQRSAVITLDDIRSIEFLETEGDGSD